MLECDERIYGRIGLSTNLSTGLISARGALVEMIGVYPGGQSGNVASVHYSDELQVWLEYRYHTLLHPQTVDSFPTNQASSTIRMVPG